ncbi:ATP-dependent DNA helicase Rep [Candidatus Tenderia electrophaga]|jgi:ATP-dependent DNA helicase Rep|uniref:ATP-dependent DNA helicase Rep n=1 Tax=Candidatus Tenderia electrophaga TaxID=1748243 RepID=A0A0S2TGM8_9GAMM|nr:ATP-dependent DNA helicase Rep [Candidatus Tenderia electrophaga]
MATLNPRQHQAVRHLDGPCLVLAGAGSGKTRVITNKIAYLIEVCGIAPHNIAAVTFTNKAAREMKQRVGELLTGKNAKGLQVSTFHTLGLNIIRQELTALGFKPNFSIFDAQDSAALIKELLRRDFGDDGGIIQQMQWQISRWKSALITPAEAPTEAGDDATLVAAAALYERYQRALKAYNAVDFDDLIMLPARLFMDHAEVQERWQNKIRYLLVDEYQDTNASQYQLIRCLTGVRGALTVVGDDDQSIYAWRGAEPENMLLLQRDYPTLSVIKLEQNYRSSGRILKAANALIKNNSHVFEDKRLWSELGYGDPIKVITLRNDEHEAEQVISELVSHKFKHRTKFRDYAILYRSNHQSRLFERSLREQRVPYYLSGGTSFFSHSEVKDMMAYLRLLVNPDDDAAFLRVVNTPRREIGPTTLEKLGNYAGERQLSLFAASFELGLEQCLNEKGVQRVRRFTRWLVETGDRAQRGDPLAAVKDVIREVNYEAWLNDSSKDLKQAEKRMANVWELVTWMQRLYENSQEDKTLAELVNHMSLMDMLDRNDADEAGDCVTLMTLHAAKGLEFPHVFLVGVEEEILPHRVSVEEGNIEEERRLAYVGITRAQKTLTISLCARRKRAGELLEVEASRFLEELPEEDLEWRGIGQQIDPEERQERGQAHLANLRGLLGTS